jgi:uncharacterized membrane protein
MYLKYVIASFLSYIEIIISLIGASIIIFTAFGAAYTYINCMIHQKYTIDIINSIRLKLGYGITLGLEFTLAADIIGSVSHPTYFELGILSIIVIIRTTLSYFLNKELESIKLENKN